MWRYIAVTVRSFCCENGGGLLIGGEFDSAQLPSTEARDPVLT